MILIFLVRQHKKLKYAILDRFDVGYLRNSDVILRRKETEIPSNTKRLENSRQIQVIYISNYSES